MPTITKKLKPSVRMNIKTVTGQEIPTLIREIRTRLLELEKACSMLDDVLGDQACNLKPKVRVKSLPK